MNKDGIAQKDFEYALELLKKLVSINTVNPPGNEIAVEEVVKAAYEKLGAAAEIMQKEKGRANFIGKLGFGKPSVGFFPHLDTVAPGEGWETDPFTPIEKDGKLYGRGTIDSKGNFASSWLAIKTFVDKHKDFKGTIYLFGCADEEMGSAKGTEYLIKKGVTVDYAIVPDGGHIDEIIIGEKGVVRLVVKSYGKQAHASTPDHGINAIDYLMLFLPNITADVFAALEFDNQFSGVTVNVGTIKGGAGVNIVPAYAEASIDIRFPYPLQKEQILEKIGTIKKDFLGRNKEAKIEIEETMDLLAHLTSRESELVSAFLDAAQDLEMSMRIGTMGGITDAKHLSIDGMQTLVHSMDDGSDTAHISNEFVVIENIQKAALLYEKTLEKLLLK